MTVLEFIASLVSSLAWPASLVIVVLVLRKHLPGLLSALKKVKVSGLELELERTRIDVQEALSAQQTPAGETEHELPAVDSKQVVGDAAIAILASYAVLEDDLRKRLRDAGVDTPERSSATQMAAVGAREGLFAESAVEAVKGVSVMRNLVAHGRADRVTTQEAEEYAALVDATLFALRTRPRT